MRTTALLVLLLCVFQSQAQVSREFIEKTVPTKYPQLIAFIETNGPQQITWTTGSREKQSMHISLSSENYLIVKADIFVGSASTASSLMEKTEVVMVDRKLNGVIDRLEATPSGGSRQSFEAPKDEGSMFLWYSSLAIAFSKLPCCGQ